MGSERRTEKITFRCTREESQEISRECIKLKICDSEYIRRCVFKKEKPQIPGNVISLLQELKRLDLKIGTNINQIVRSCNSKGFVSRTDYKSLVELLQELSGHYEHIYTRIEQELKYGNNKTS